MPFLPYPDVRTVLPVGRSISGEFFKRYTEIVIDNNLITSNELDVYFDVTGEKEDTGALAKINIYNLNVNTRNSIKVGSGVLLKSGYKDNFGQIFLGTVSRIEHVREEGDLRTDLTVVDSAIDYSKVRLATSKSWPAKTKITSIARDIITSCSLTVGCIDDSNASYPSSFSIASNTTLGEVFSTLAKDLQAQDPAHRQWISLWKNNGIYLIIVSTPVVEEVFDLTPQTGLLEVRAVEDDQMSTTIDFHVKSLLIHQLSSGSAFYVNGAFVEVIYYRHVSDEDSHYSHLDVRTIRPAEPKTQPPAPGSDVGYHVKYGIPWELARAAAGG